MSSNSNNSSGSSNQHGSLPPIRTKFPYIDFPPQDPQPQDPQPQDPQPTFEVYNNNMDRIARSTNPNTPMKVSGHGGKHVCKVCGSSFPTPSALATHIRSHTGVKPFHCHVCGKSFSVKPNMQRHIRTMHQCD